MLHHHQGFPPQLAQTLLTPVNTNLTPTHTNGMSSPTNGATTPANNNNNNISPTTSDPATPGEECELSPTPPQTITIRLIMQGKEVGSIIGKRGDTIKKFRTESGARINISDGQSIERIVTLTGANECLNKAFHMISYKFEEDMSEGLTTDCPKPPVTLRLIVPASQCGSIIGKGGSKIKEIREHTGCTIQVAGDFLPQSTERAVTISGMPEAITKCIMEICKIMAESPPKGTTLPYRPKPNSTSSMNGHSQLSHSVSGVANLNQTAMLYSPAAAAAAAAYGLQSPTAAGQFLSNSQSPQDIAKLQAQLAAGLYNPFLQTMPFPGVAHGGNFAGGHPNSTQEYTISNDLIGCVIGPNGTRINDISLGIDASTFCNGLYTSAAQNNLSAQMLSQFLNPTAYLGNPTTNGFSLAQSAAAAGLTSSPNVATGFPVTSSSGGVSAASNPSLVAAAMTGNNLVNVMRPGYANLKKARNETAPY